MVHKSLFPAVGGFPESENLKAIEDYALWLRIAMLTEFAYYRQPLLNYRDDPFSSLRSENHSESIQKIRVFTDTLKWSKANRSLDNYVKMLRKHYRYAFIDSNKETLQSFMSKLKRALSR
jgi:hypothetical protein